jgi:ABC-type phosphate/phosphonate transport system substrate-binding protein
MSAMLRLVSLLAENARPFYERIAQYLAGQLAAPVELLGGPLPERRRRLDAGDADVAFICGWPYALRHDRPEPQIELLCAPVMAAPRYGGRPVYFTDVIVRQDHPARDFAGLRGAVWSYNDLGSHSGYNVTRHHLLQLGETRGYFGRVVDAGTHQGSIQMVLDGAIDASGIDSTVLETELVRRPEIRAALRTIATLGPGPIPPVAVARHVEPELAARLQDLFLGMAADPAGLAVLAAGRVATFVTVRDADYDPIREMARRAEAAGFLTLR